MTEDPHFGFLLAAYVVAAVTLAGLILWVVLDHRAQTRALEALKAAGITRRAKDSAE